MRQERDELREDMRICAGECVVPVPEPGTVAARLLSGNVLLRAALRRSEQRELEALAELDEARALAVEMWQRRDDWHGERSSSHYRSDLADRLQALAPEVKR